MWRQQATNNMKKTSNPILISNFPKIRCIANDP